MDDYEDHKKEVSEESEPGSANNIDGKKITSFLRGGVKDLVKATGRLAGVDATQVTQAYTDEGDKHRIQNLEKQIKLEKEKMPALEREHIKLSMNHDLLINNI